MNRGAFYGIVASFLWFKMNLPVWFILLVLFSVYVAMGGYKFINMFFRTFIRDATGLSRYIRVQLTMRYYARNNMTVPRIFEAMVKKHPDRTCFIFEDTKWTFREVNEYANRVAHVFQAAGYKPGDTVALLLDNRPEYVALWLGLAKAGIVTALLNYNLRDKPLVHSITIAESKAVIVGAVFNDAFTSIRDQLGPDVAMYGFDYGTSSLPANCINLDAALRDASSEPLPGPPIGNYADKMLYIFTSGTTGLPKAAVIRHSRYLFATFGVFYAIGMELTDRPYVPLPLYHTAGGILGAGTVLLGLTVVIKKKFSVRSFWKDCIEHDCTVAQYIGETCRYLLAAPPSAEERSHQIRLMFGNGLRPQIWEEFTKRFGIEKIAEFYGATEGNANIINFDGTVGAVGFVSLIAPAVYPVGLIKVTEEDDPVPIRGPNGLCIPCKPGEPGMFVGKIVNNDPVRDFHGYADKSATKKKVAYDVFKRGDAAFLSGDILVMDELGYLFFLDRTGDTFRWRGENVSTTEVEAVISNVAGLKDCVVYGVEVPGNEGRAGMAAILDPEGELDLVDLAKEMGKVLPAYARPLFIRIIKNMRMTGTYKLQKKEYQKEGYQLDKSNGDVIYFWDATSRSYVKFTAELDENIKSGKIRI